MPKKFLVTQDFVLNDYSFEHTPAASSAGEILLLIAIHLHMKFTVIWINIKKLSSEIQKSMQLTLKITLLNNLLKKINREQKNHKHNPINQILNSLTSNSYQVGLNKNILALMYHILFNLIDIWVISKPLSTICPVMLSQKT